MNIRFLEIIEKLDLDWDVALFLFTDRFPYCQVLPTFISGSQYRQFITYLSKLEYDAMDLSLILGVDIDEEDLQDLKGYCGYIHRNFKGKRSDLRLLFRH